MKNTDARTYIVSGRNAYGKSDHPLTAVSNWIRELGREASKAKTIEIMAMDCEPEKVQIGGGMYKFPADCIIRSWVLDGPTEEVVERFMSRLADFEAVELDAYVPYEAKFDELEDELRAAQQEAGQ